MTAQWGVSKRTTRFTAVHAYAEHNVWTGDGWRVSSETVEDPDRRRLMRRIVSHREIGGADRRDEEPHELALFDHEQVFAALRETGFAVRSLAGYAGEYQFSVGHGGFLALRAEER